MQLNELQGKPGARHRKMRVGRGIGSSKGKTCGRGGKGQTARTGVRIKGFEGGQTPIHRRLPKRGFNNHSRRDIATVNLSAIEKAIESGRLDAKKEINLDALKAAGLARKSTSEIKLLAKGESKSKLIIAVDHASASAKAAIEKSGGKLTLKAAS